MLMLIQVRSKLQGVKTKIEKFTEKHFLTVGFRDKKRGVLF